VLKSVLQPPEEEYYQAPIVYVDYTRSQLSPAIQSCLSIQPNTVICHVYDLNAGLTQANELTGFHAGFGGAFHAGIEVYGGEWAYGVAGVDCELPRSTTSHAYKCSVILGNTHLDRVGVAKMLKVLVDEWEGGKYDTLGKNCCSFAAELCERLGCQPLPPWVDRLPKTLHSAQQAGVAAQLRVQSITHETAQYAQELHSKAQPHLEYAADVGNQVLVASRDAIEKVDRHASNFMHGLWENVYSAAEKVKERWNGTEDAEERSERILQELPVEHGTPDHQSGFHHHHPVIRQASFNAPPSALAMLHSHGDTNSMLSGYQSFDSSSTLPAYPGSDYGVNTMPSLVPHSITAVPHPAPAGQQLPYATPQQAANPFDPKHTPSAGSAIAAPSIANFTGRADSIYRVDSISSQGSAHYANRHQQAVPAAPTPRRGNSSILPTSQSRGPVTVLPTKESFVLPRQESFGNSSHRGSIAAGPSRESRPFQSGLSRPMPLGFQ
jgi:hypothetical protein